MYVGRAFHQGDMLPAKIVPSHGCAYVSYNGAEYSVRQYEVSVTTSSSGASEALPPGA
jgi:predicted HAD superfamily phosphohydrolase